MTGPKPWAASHSLVKMCWPPVKRLLSSEVIFGNGPPRPDWASTLRAPQRSGSSRAAAANKRTTTAEQIRNVLSTRGVLLIGLLLKSTAQPWGPLGREELPIWSGHYVRRVKAEH